MEEKILDKVIEEVWGKWISVLILVVVSAIVVVKMIISIFESNFNTVQRDGAAYHELTCAGVILIVLVVLCAVIINTIYFIYVLSHNSIRKARKNAIGILIFIDAPTIGVYKDAVRKFGNEFKNNFRTAFDVVFIPYGIKDISYKDEAIGQLLRKKRCLLMLQIGINTDTDKDSIIYDMQISGVIIHPTYKENVEKEFQKIFTDALYKFRDIEFKSNDMIKKLRVAASEMSYACQYVIGLSMFLNGDFIKAENVLSELACQKENTVQWCKLFGSIQRIRYVIFVALARKKIEQYQSCCEDEEVLDSIDELMEKARECGGQTYEYCLNKAYYAVAKNRDSIKAKKYINMCKQMKGVPLVWRYSEAFLKAYDNKSLETIVSSYRRALKVDYNIQDLIIFIEMILGKEPERIGLYLALGILYNYVDDNYLSKENFEKYIINSDNPENARKVLAKKSLL